MRVTIEIDDALWTRLKARALQRGLTLRQLVDELAREGLWRPAPGRPYVLRDLSFKGDGLVPGINLEDREQMRRILYPDS